MNKFLSRLKWRWYTVKEDSKWEKIPPPSCPYCGATMEKGRIWAFGRGLLYWCPAEKVPPMWPSPPGDVTIHLRNSNISIWSDIEYADCCRFCKKIVVDYKADP